MVDQLTEEDIAELKEIFIRQDKDGDGFIPVSDLGTMFQEMKFYASEADLKDFAEDIDPDGYGQIDFCEFLSLIIRKFKFNSSEEDLFEAFKVYDRDGNGFITGNELTQVMNKLGQDVTAEEVSQIINELDTHGDGMISYGDFLNAMTNSDLE
eukprot:TRINITY_DN1172_c0_g1_i1.p1 TRINITY_DN1172_c0_g1~~TRINITY_DN1172_c0_g1_i1.p1  ORF type:complete len:153 (-),score=57.31 TRINITY_DN1172_c0_g1_i1:63-521(-)